MKKYLEFITESNEVRDINWFIKTNNISLDVDELYCDYNKLTSLKGIENLNNLTLLNCVNNNLPYSNDNLDTIKKEIRKEIRNQKLIELGI